MGLGTITRGKAIGAVVAASLLHGSKAGAQSSPELTVIRVASGPTDQVAPLLYAINAGLFRRAGLDVSITLMRSGTEIASAVVGGGSLEVGGGDVVVPILAHSQGVPLTIVAPTLLYDVSNQNVGMLVKGSSTIQSAKDLSGKIIGVSALNNSFALASMAWLDRNGVDIKSVKFTEIPPTTTGPALEQGRVDAMVAYEPIMSGAVAQGARIIGYPFEAFGRRSEPSAYFSSIAWASAHKRELQAFRDVLHTAGQYVSDHETDVYPLTAKFTGLPVEVVAKNKPSVRALSLDPRLIQPYIDAAAKYKFIPQQFNARDLIS